MTSPRCGGPPTKSCIPTLQAVSTSRTRLEREFDPAAIRALKASSPRDLSIGGPGLAACAIRAGLVDEWQLYLVPALVGGGIPALPADVRLDLRLVDERRFEGGTVFLHYRTR
jgi:dihydrofolate reductase